MHHVARYTGAVLRTGRRRETVSSIAWEPSFPGSQRALIPDLILDYEDATIIVDAKYKRHWEELHDGSWQNHETFREQHRADLLQVLAYANLAPRSDVICCLIYPCSPATWRSLANRGRHFHQAEFQTRERRVRLWLSAIPMGLAVSNVAEPFIKQLHKTSYLRNS
jgi:5-methylcytosine-specific restriction endonuclease McrBC regulatory subunit McrC